jgi:hypothetical protein
MANRIHWIRNAGIPEVCTQEAQVNVMEDGAGLAAQVLAGS